MLENWLENSNWKIEKYLDFLWRFADTLIALKHQK